MEEQPTLKVYKRRWIALSYFCLFSMANAVTWITFSPISDLVEIYYSVSSFWVNALSVIFMIAYLPVVFVASWFLDHKGLRLGLVVGGVLTVAGVWIRAIANWFAPVFIGQVSCEH
jgi:FLVCR family feline leukemia virus subgroup C receptor-related protein